MFEHNHLSAAALVALSVVAQHAAADDVATPQHVEITGSSLPQLAGETALPVQTITQEQIAQSGYTSVTDLIQNLASMQGFTTNSMSANGGANGAASASIHALGTSYTLVLLNGRRMAPYDTGSSVNLNVVPLSAIDHVEVLTDGASALYGSDAIAGVVNLITKKSGTDGSFDFNVSRPQHPGGGAKSVSVSKGFGDLDKDKWNFRLSAGFDKQDELAASQRSFSNSGVLNFEDQGKLQQVGVLSSSAAPANIPSLTLSDGTSISNINAFLLKNGSCPPGTVQSGNRCLFTYTTQADSIPASERASVYGNGIVELSPNVSLFGELSLSRYFNVVKYASAAESNLSIPSSLLQQDVDPLLTSLGYAAGTTATSGTMNLRVVGTGPRIERYGTDNLHAVIGSDFRVGDWDGSASYTHSQNNFTDRAEGGFVDYNGLMSLISSGAYDPLENTGTASSALDSIVLHQTIDQAKSSLDVLSTHGSTTVGHLKGGDVNLAVGADFTRQKYTDSPSAIEQGKNALQPDYTDAIVGGYSGILPFAASRNSYGVFSEVDLPVTKTLDVTGSARYDSYDAVRNTANFDSNGNPVDSATQGSKNSSGTYKLSLRFQPVHELLLRGSVGTGFKAPTLLDIAQPLEASGNTAFHSCPPGLSADLAALCGSAPESYNSQSGGNPSTGAGALKPEKSTQWTAGFKYEASKMLSFGADYWGVRLSNQINTITEDTAFSNGATYGYLFKAAQDPVSGNTVLTFLNQPVNTGNAMYQGIDFDATLTNRTSIGLLTTRLNGTYMLKADYQSPGVAGYMNSLGHIGSDGTVVFRYLLNLSSTLKTGAWANTLQLKFKPGYMDDTSSYCRADSDGNCLVNSKGQTEGRQVSGYLIVDWQARYDITKQATLTVGIKNLFDRTPPFTLTAVGGTPVGFDGRYADATGRALYVGGSYKF